MKYSFSPYNLKGRDKTLQRIFEIMPGLSSWIIIIGLMALSYIRPIWATILIIAFLIYWLLRLLYMNIFLILSYMRLSIEKETDWEARINEIDGLIGKKDPKTRVSGRKGLKQRISFMIHKKRLKTLRKTDALPPPSKEIYHLVIIPAVKEDKTILGPGILSLLENKTLVKQMLVVLAVEERAEERIKKDAYELKEKFEKHFYDFLVIIHPDGISGEIKAKGANVTFAAKKAKEYFEEQKIPCENVVVSCFDADTVVGANYFSSLTYYFQISPERYRISFQPIPVYHNNIWDAPWFARVLDVGSSFFQMIEATNTETLITFSSHSMSFRALIDVGYWPIDMISEDSAIFWKCFIHFDSHYKVIPMYITLSMDVNQGPTWWQTIINVYKQRRRWAWGAENFPQVMRAFIKSSRIPLLVRIKYGFRLFEKIVSWPTWPILLTVVSWLPLVFADREFSQTVLYFSFPRIRKTIFVLSSFGLIICIVLSLLLLPKKRIKYPLIKRILHIFEWTCVPLAALFLNGIPALDAQTRLLLKKYMVFWVTPKNRK